MCQLIVMKTMSDVHVPIYLSIGEPQNAYYEHNQSSDELEHGTNYHYSS